jgi:hypothetical protein
VTTPGGAAVPVFTPRRRSLLLAGLGGASAAALAPLGQGAAAAAPAAAPVAFDFDTGNFIVELISRLRVTGDDIASGDVTVLERLNHYSAVSWYDATAPYHRTAVGVFSRLGRRPAAEAATNRNRNIAALYAQKQVINGIDPVRRASVYKELMQSVGLNPDDESVDPTTPIGIGNLAGKAVVAAALNDGANQLGNLGRRYNGQPYEDYTGYRPVNTAYDLKDASRWQPRAGTHNRRLGGGYGDLGIYTVQTFVNPQTRLIKAHSYRDPAQFKLPAPFFTDASRLRDYRRSVDEMLAASAGLTDEQKVIAEFYDNKRLGIGLAMGTAVLAHPGLDLDGWVQAMLTSSVAIFDALIAAWHQKAKFDAVRPWSAIRHVYGNAKVTAWGGPRRGTVHDMPADEWAPYLFTNDHPEYPSGSTVLCAAEAQAARRFFGDNVLELTFSYPAGSTLVEPGLTPANDITLHFATWDDFLQKCAASRVWGGVHFTKTVEVSLGFGKQFGDLAYEWVQRRVRGNVS